MHSQTIPVRLSICKKLIMDTSEGEWFLTYLEDSKDKNAIDEATKEVKDYVDIIRHNNEIEGTYMTLGDLMDKWKAEMVEEKEAENNRKLQEKDEELSKKDDELLKKDEELSKKDEELQRYKKMYEDAINRK